MIMMAMTQAKTGRFRKNLDNMMRLRQFGFTAGWLVPSACAGSGPGLNATVLAALPGRTRCAPSAIT
jgi:hypothetical protein